jgi:hypothetical protein
MMDALTICGFVASMRHAGYLSVAAAVLGLAEAHYPELRRAVLRARAWLVSARGATARRPTTAPRRGISKSCAASMR